MRALNLELSAFPDIQLFGHTAEDWDVGENCPCENTVVTGFLYEGEGFSVRSQKLKVVAKTDLVNLYGQRVPHETYERDVVKAISKFWPGMAVHA